MKMRDEHFQSIKAACEKALVDMNKVAVQQGKKDAATWYVDKGHSVMRYRWDVFHFSGWMKGTEFEPEQVTGQTGNIGAAYEYMNDDHIDTALRKIMRGAEWEGK